MNVLQHSQWNRIYTYVIDNSYYLKIGNGQRREYKLSLSVFQIAEIKITKIWKTVESQNIGDSWHLEIIHTCSVMLFMSQGIIFMKLKVVFNLWSN